MIHHIALATKDIRRSHHFYTSAMGFRLVKVVKRKAPGGGWTKHVFYDMGDGSLFALWDLRGLESEALDPASWRAALSSGLGLPPWVNHIAFEAQNEEDFERHRKLWLDHGYHVSEVDHEFIRSIYTLDPDGTMVEWTYRLRPLAEADWSEAAELLGDDTPATIPDYEGTFTRSTAKKWKPDA
jgi:catechol 2,3-dioxygenase-like lactoylglutathione lyase family enzyme